MPDSCTLNYNFTTVNEELVLLMFDEEEQILHTVNKMVAQTPIAALKRS